MLKKSNIEEIDFNALYKKQRQESFFKPKNRDDWNKKASDFNAKSSGSVYNDEFARRVFVEKENTVLDVGCGTGNLSLYFAKKAKLVHAMDFSPAMLELLEKNAKKSGLTNIQSYELSWEDEWDILPEADIVIASRSMEVNDMREALLKLNKKARKRVYITYKVGGSFVDPKSLGVIKKEISPKPDYIYIVNILYQLGITAKVDFIESEGRGAFLNSADDYVNSIMWSIGDLSESEKKLLKEYYDSLDEDEKKYLNEANRWAFIHWEKDERN